MKALVVDDTSNNRSIVVEILSAAGIVVHEADGADACMRSLEAERYDLVLMDIRMPGVDGIEAIQKIRCMAGESANVPIIVMTADVRDDCAARALAAGARTVIHKPVNLAALLNAVVHCMSHSGELLLA